MATTSRIVLFSEVNSKLGLPFLEMLDHHPMVDLLAIVTSPVGKLCDYFLSDDRQVDLESRAKELGVPVFRPNSVNEPEFVEQLKALAPDYLIVGNFQQILRSGVLSAPRETSVNFHPSPLPRYAGLAPFYWMVRNGEKNSAVTAIEIADGLDTGAILAQRTVPVTGYETGIELRTLQERANVHLLLELIPQLANRTLTRVPQDLAERTYFTRPGHEDYRLDFTDTAVNIMAKVRAAYRNPGAFAHASNGQIVTILSVAQSAHFDLEGQFSPGLVRATEYGVFVGCADSWLQILTIEEDGLEIPASGSTLVDGALFGFNSLSSASEGALL